jgi:isoquinoline 1-oxidoreductase beta subunit
MPINVLELGEKPKRITRRGLLIGGGVGAGLLVAWAVWPRDYAQNLTAAKGEHIINGFVKVGEDGHVTVVVPQIEMGQGAYTLIPQIVADELGADWRQIAVEPAPVNPLYANRLLAREWAEGTGTWLFGDAARWFAAEVAQRSALQVTGNSSTVRGLGLEVRRAAAAARAVLAMAAGQKWDADWRACETEGGFVIRGDDRLRFADLAAEAAGFDPPETIPLRQGRENRLVGQSLPRLDLPAKVDGSSNYAADIRLPGMVYAAIRMGPLGDAVVQPLNKKAIAGNAEIIKLVEQKHWVAVVGKTWWAANQALATLNPRFANRSKAPDSKTARTALTKAFESKGRPMANVGDVAAVFGSGRLLRADYTVDLAPHVAMEPMAATAAVREGRLELWVSTQAPSLARKAAADASGFDEHDVIVHPMQLGGSFGRKYEVEIAAQAAILATQIDKPVQLIWSREEDMGQDRFRPMAAARLFARMGGAGRIEGWRARIAAPATIAEMQARIIGGATASEAEASEAEGTDASIVAGAFPPYAIPNLRIDLHPVSLGIPTGKWRSGAHSYTSFFTESFIDELAKASNIEAFSFRMAMLGANPRLAFCLSRAAILANWEGGEAGTQQGIACHAMLGSHIAIVANAQVGDDQQIVVRRLVAVADVGRVVNPDIVRQQIEGGLLFGLAAATGNRTIVTNGQVSPRRIGELRLPRLADSPELLVEIIRSNEAPGGIGELAVPPVAPAIANALFAGSGKRYRQLPLNPAN